MTPNICFPGVHEKILQFEKVSWGSGVCTDWSIKRLISNLWLLHTCSLCHYSKSCLVQWSSVKLDPSAREIMASLTPSLNDASAIKTRMTATATRPGQILLHTQQGWNQLRDVSGAHFSRSDNYLRHFKCSSERSEEQAAGFGSEVEIRSVTTELQEWILQFHFYSSITSKMWSYRCGKRSGLLPRHVKCQQCCQVRRNCRFSVL